MPLRLYYQPDKTPRTDLRRMTSVYVLVYCHARKACSAKEERGIVPCPQGTDLGYEHSGVEVLKHIFTHSPRKNLQYYPPKLRIWIIPFAWVESAALSSLVN